MADERFPEDVDLRRLDLEPGRGAVTAEPDQVRRAGAEPGVEVEAGDAATRPAAATVREGDHHARSVMALDHPRGDDPDHTGVPVLAREHVRRRLRMLGPRGLGGKEDPCLDILALAVEQVQLICDSGRPVLVLGQDELEARVGAGEAARGVDARREAEPERVLVDRDGVDARHAHECPQPGTASARHRFEPLTDEPAVLAAQRHHVGDRGERDQVGVLAADRGVLAGGSQQSLRHLLSHTGGAEVLERVPAHGRVEHRAIGERFSGPVVVGDEHVDPELTRAGDLRHGSDRAIGGND